MNTSEQKTQTIKQNQEKAQEEELIDSESEDDEIEENEEEDNQQNYFNGLSHMQEELVVTKRLLARIRVLKGKYTHPAFINP